MYLCPVTLQSLKHDSARGEHWKMLAESHNIEVEVKNGNHEIFEEIIGKIVKVRDYLFWDHIPLFFIF